MMTGTLALIIALSAGAGVSAFFLIKSLTRPKKVEAIAGLLEAGKGQAAIKAAKAILAGDGGNAQARISLGKAYLLEGLPEPALKEYRAVLASGLAENNINEPAFRRELAQLYIKTGQIKEALTEYVFLLKAEPDRSENYYWAGKLSLRCSRLEMAESYLRRAAALSPRDGKIHHELGVLLFRQQKTNDARGELEEALALQPGNFEARYYLGKIQKEEKDYQGAMASFEQAGRNPALKLKALVEKGSCLMALKGFDKAIPELERAVRAIPREDNPDGLYARYFLALCYEKTGSPDKAIAQWDRIAAVKRDFRDVEAKLKRYGEFRDDDRMKDYLAAGTAVFAALCRGIAEQGLGLKMEKCSPTGEGCEIVAVPAETARLLNVRKQPWLLRFLRSAGPVEAGEVQKLLEDVKNMTRGVLVTNTGFTGEARRLAESRPVELIGKERLQELLGRVKIKSRIK